MSTPPSFPDLPLTPWAKVETPNVQLSQAFMKNVQGGILAGRGRGKHVAVLFFRFSNSTDAKENSAVVHTAANTVTDALTQYRSARRKFWPRFLHSFYIWFFKVQTPLFRSFLMTANGLEACGISPANTAGGNFFPTTNGSPVLFESMNDDAVASGLNDQMTETWSPEYRQRIDGGWLIAHETEAGLKQGISEMKKSWSGKGLQFLHDELGSVQKKEPFGFDDGISMQRFFHDRRERPFALETKLEQVFLQDDRHRGSSFMVLRKLEQDVRAFRNFADQAGPTATARLFGRKPNGDPLVSSSRRFWPRNQNDFDFLTDQGGSKCPFHAHIRSMNPRKTFAGELRIVRRGVVYGDPTKPDDDNRVGLLFMAYMHDLATFKTLQQEWSVIPPGSGARVDPDRILYGPDNDALTSLTRWVRPKGGAYFFVPSLQWMRSVQPDQPKA